MWSHAGIIRTVALAGCLAAAFSPGPVAAQAVAQALQQQLDMAEQAAAANRQALQPYSWIETTQISVKGEVKNTKVESCRYGPGGQVQRTELSDNSADMPPGLRGMMAKKKAGEVQAELKNAAALVRQYVPLDPARVRAVIAAGGASLGQAGPGTAQVKFANFAQQGDVLTLTVDTQTQKIDRIDVATWLDSESNKVSLGVDVDSLPDGTRFPATSTVLIPGSDIQVQMRNTNYQKLAM